MHPPIGARLPVTDRDANRPYEAPKKWREVKRITTHHANYSSATARPAAAAPVHIAPKHGTAAAARVVPVLPPPLSADTAPPAGTVAVFPQAQPLSSPAAAPAAGRVPSMAMQPLLPQRLQDMLPQRLCMSRPRTGLRLLRG